MKQDEFERIFSRENYPEGNSTGEEARDASKPRETQHETPDHACGEPTQQTYQDKRKKHDLSTDSWCTVCGASRVAIEDGLISEWCGGEPLRNHTKPYEEVPVHGFGMARPSPDATELLDTKPVFDRYFGTPSLPPDGVALNSMLHPSTLETIEIVLPEAHWMRTAFETWKHSDSYREYRSACVELATNKNPDVVPWLAFRAGANAIPGNPDRVRVLEQELNDMSVDQRVLVLERQCEALEMATQAQASYIGQLNETTRKHETELNAYDKAWTDKLIQLSSSAIETRNELNERVTSLEEYNEPPNDSERAAWEGRYLRLETALKAYTQLCDSHELGFGQQGKCIVENYSLALSALTETNARVTNLETAVNDTNTRLILDLRQRIDGLSLEAGAESKIRGAGIHSLSERISQLEDGDGKRLDACDRAIIANAGQTSRLHAKVDDLAQRLTMVVARDMRLLNEREAELGKRVSDLEKTASVTTTRALEDIRERLTNLEDRNHGR